MKARCLPISGPRCDIRRTFLISRCPSLPNITRRSPRFFISRKISGMSEFAGIASENKRATRSYYLTLDMIEPNRFDFVLVSPVTPKGRANLRAMALAGSDSSSYGKLIVYSLQEGGTGLRAGADQRPDQPGYNGLAAVHLMGSGGISGGAGQYGHFPHRKDARLHSTCLPEVVGKPENS